MLVTGVTEVSHLVSLVPQSWRSRDRLYRHSHSLLDLRPFPALSAHQTKKVHSLELQGAAEPGQHTSRWLAPVLAMVNTREPELQFMSFGGQRVSAFPTLLDTGCELMLSGFFASANASAVCDRG